jgi:hypothetical protein
MTTKEAIAKAPRARPKRTAIGTRSVLTVDQKDSDYEYRFVNDTNSRVEAFQRNGWEVVPAKEAVIGAPRVDQPSPDGSAAVVSVGGGTKAVLLRIHKDWYLEDQLDKQRQIDALEQTMKEDAQRDNYGKLAITRE